MAVTGITDKNDQIVLGIIGDPIKQVKSPATFGEYFRLHGINAVMVPLPVESDDFERVLEGLRGVKNFGGAVVTIPHKYEAYKMAYSSISVTVASVNRAEYCISKAGLSMLTKLFACRLGEFNIPVYEVQQGITKTDMTKMVNEKYDKMLEEGLCLTARWGFPKDVGKIVASLSRGDFLYSTGQIVIVDGGLSVSRL